MLGHTYRLQAYNGTGVSVTITAKTRPYKFASDGAIVFAAEATRISAVSTATLAYTNSSTVDNSSALNLDALITWVAAPASSATGPVTLYLQRSTDGGTTWPSNGHGVPISTIAFSASATSVTRNAETV